MKTLVISYLPANKLWCYIDTTQTVHTIHGAALRLSSLRPKIELWQDEHRDGVVRIECDDVHLPLNTDDDWAIAILRFS